MLSVVIASSFAAASRAEQNSKPRTEKNWDQVCRKVQAESFTPVELPGPLAPDQLLKCDEQDLYYGFGKQPDYSAARQCGLYQRAHPQTAEGNMFYGPGVLTMLYANGKGIPQNYSLAIRFACEQAWASDAEMEYRLGHLEHLQATHAHNATFDLCDDTTSGLSQGACANIAVRNRDAARAPKIAAAVAGLSQHAQCLFPALQATEAAFEEARVQNEVDLSGTGRAAFELEEEARLRDQFLINLQKFGHSDIPAASETQLTDLNLKLNAVYETIERSPVSDWQDETVKPESIRKTEQAWVLLADTWISFARVAYPNLSATRIRAQLVRLRMHQLQSSFNRVE